MRRIEQTLRDNIHEEGEAVLDYTKAARTARKLGNIPASKLFMHIRDQEKHHKVELTQMLRKVKKVQ